MSKIITLDSAKHNKLFGQAGITQGPLSLNEIKKQQHQQELGPDDYLVEVRGSDISNLNYANGMLRTLSHMLHRHMLWHVSAPKQMVGKCALWLSLALEKREAVGDEASESPAVRYTTISDELMLHLASR